MSTMISLFVLIAGLKALVLPLEGEMVIVCFGVLLFVVWVCGGRLW